MNYTKQTSEDSFMKALVVLALLLAVAIVADREAYAQENRKPQNQMMQEEALRAELARQAEIERQDIEHQAEAERLVNLKRLEFELAAQQEMMKATEANELAQIRAHLARTKQQMAQAERRMAEEARKIARYAELNREQSLTNYSGVMSVLSEGLLLGVSLENEQSPDNAKGLKIAGVSPTGPADKAGLQPGDVIVAIDDVSMASDKEADSRTKFKEYIVKVNPGDKINVEYLRDGKTNKLAVETGEIVRGPNFAFNPRNNRVLAAPSPASSFFPNLHWVSNVWGDMEMTTLSEQLGGYFGTKSGLLVIRAPSHDALELEDGDVILDIGGREPQSVSHAMSILSSYRNGEDLTILIMRDKKKRSLKMKVPEPENIGSLEALLRSNGATGDIDIIKP